jgi:hypothetical protein
MKTEGDAPAKGEVKRDTWLPFAAIPAHRPSRAMVKNIFNTPIAFKWQSSIVRIVLD